MIIDAYSSVRYIIYVNLSIIGQLYTVNSVSVQVYVYLSR